MKILVTGAAGFIGYHTSKRLMDDGHEVIGYDIVDDYYDVNLKLARLNMLKDYDKFTFLQKNINDKEAVDAMFKTHEPQRVVHLAAQAGVRHSIDHPHMFIKDNVEGFLHMLECCRHFKTEHLVYASTSSVYGLNENFPFKESDNVDHPVSFYGATKKANELMAHTYSHLFNLPTTGLRFFTVYGPWGRPDMALFLFTSAIAEKRPLDVYNYGKMARDFTYIDDIVEGIVRVLMKAPEPDSDWTSEAPNPASSSAPYRVYNIGSTQSVDLLDFIREIEKNLGMKGELNMMPMQPGDVVKSLADASLLVKDFGYQPKYGVEHGIKQFVDWYVDYYNVKRPG